LGGGEPLTTFQGEGDVLGEDAEGEEVPAMRPGTAPKGGEEEIGGDSRDLEEAAEVRASPSWNWDDVGEASLSFARHSAEQ
jgi:hypothetical protein